MVKVVQGAASEIVKDGPTFMLYMQVEEEKKFSINSLREENIRLTQECTSLRSALVLSEEQVRDHSYIIYDHSI